LEIFMSQIGDNTGTIDYAAEEIARLEQDYGYLGASVSDLRDEAAKIELPINDEATKGTVMSLIKRVRDQAKAIAGLHAMEKTPHLRRGQGTDQFFFRLEEALAKRERKAKNGIGDELGAALTDYDNRKLAEEMERRRQEAERLRREAEAKAKAEAEALRKAEEARLAAERARKAETQAAKGAVAQESGVQAAAAAAEATTAHDKAEEAYINTFAKPADIMRTRGTDGTLGTMKQEPYAEIVDAAKLQMELLWPFISIDAKEKALRSWARTTGHKVQMEGAAIGFRNKSRVR
jgi:hypothetical protein